MCNHNLRKIYEHILIIYILKTLSMSNISLLIYFLSRHSAQRMLLHNVILITATGPAGVSKHFILQRGIITTYFKEFEHRV